MFTLTVNAAHPLAARALKPTLAYKNEYAAMSHSNGNHTANVIQRLVSHDHDITLFSKRLAHSLKAEVTGSIQKPDCFSWKSAPPEET
jgi:hypothetical protein